MVPFGVGQDMLMQFGGARPCVHSVGADGAHGAPGGVLCCGASVLLGLWVLLVVLVVSLWCLESYGVTVLFVHLQFLSLRILLGGHSLVPFPYESFFSWPFWSSSYCELIFLSSYLPVL